MSESNEKIRKIKSNVILKKRNRNWSQGHFGVSGGAIKVKEKEKERQRK